MKLKYPKSFLSMLLVSLSFNLFADVSWNWQKINIYGNPLEGVSPSLAKVGGLTARGGGQPIILLYRDGLNASGGNIWAATAIVYDGSTIYSWRPNLQPLFKGWAGNPSVVSIGGVDKAGNSQVVATYEDFGSSGSNPTKVMAGIGTVSQGDYLVWSSFSVAALGNFVRAGSSMAAIGEDRSGNQEVLIVYQKQNDVLQAKIGTVNKANNTISWRDADNFWDEKGKHYIEGNYPSVAYLGKDDSGNRLVLIVHNDYGSNNSKGMQRKWAEIGTIDKNTGSLLIKYSENFFDNNTDKYTEITLLGKDSEGKQKVIAGNKIGTIDVKAPRLYEYARIKWEDFNGTNITSVPVSYDNAGNPTLFGVDSDRRNLYFGVGKVTTK